MTTYSQTQGQNQQIYDSMDYLPYGEQIAGSTGTTHKFTGKERDSESGLDYFGARHHASTMGRFLSPDPSNLSVDFWLPQTWNRYSYVLNNPLSMDDRNGLWPWYIHDRIIDQAFPGMSTQDLRALKDASWNMDYRFWQRTAYNYRPVVTCACWIPAMVRAISVESERLVALCARIESLEFQCKHFRASRSASLPANVWDGMERVRSDATTASATAATAATTANSASLLYDWRSDDLPNLLM